MRSDDGWPAKSRSGFATWIYRMENRVKKGSEHPLLLHRYTTDQNYLLVLRDHSLFLLFAWLYKPMPACKGSDYTIPNKNYILHTLILGVPIFCFIGNS